jgi:hypothetical protein
MTRTQCLGLMIRDMIEGRSMQLLNDDGEARPAGEVWLRIEFVDVSDADNPVVLFEDGSTLTVRIFSP